jgi:hypothetical protein
MCGRGRERARDHHLLLAEGLLQLLLLEHSLVAPLLHVELARVDLRGKRKGQRRIERAGA